MLTFSYGVMTCGKTSRLLQTVYSYDTRGLKVLVSKPALDVKAGSAVSSRVGISRETDFLIGSASNVSASFAGVAQLTNEGLFTLSGDNVVAVFVDEAQFLSKSQVDELMLLSHSVPVHSYGLRTDFMGNAFEGSSRLFEVADVLVELPTICACGSKAVFNQRVVDGVPVLEGSQLVLDVPDSGVDYVPVCSVCFVNGR